MLDMNRVVRLKVVTASGSVYEAEQLAHWWIFASYQNAVSPVSNKDMGDRWWVIADPEAPVLGKRWHFHALPEFELNDPERLPGGGKYTSPVAEIWVMHHGSSEFVKYQHELPPIYATQEEVV